MPLYDYKCSKCEHKFEQFQKIKDRLKPQKKPCPSCGKTKCVQHQIGNPAICDPHTINAAKPDKGWLEVMEKVKKANRGHKIIDRWGS